MLDHIRIGSLMVLSCLLWTACGGGVTTTGYNTKEFMPLDDGIIWLYEKVEDDDGLLYKVFAQSEETVNGEAVSVFAWKYATRQELDLDEEGADELFFMETYWSKAEGGVFFHGSDAAVGTSGVDPWATLVYEYPLQFGKVNAWEGDITESGSDAESWSSEFVAMEDIVTDGGDFPDCMHIRFSEADGLSPFSGDYWVARNTGIVQFTRDIDPDVIWALKTFE